ncbi:MAG: cytochrome c [Acidimicrobiia bacterium]|nr:cytochrome c [Acidimicrobiia bacterium]
MKRLAAALALLVAGCGGGDGTVVRGDPGAGAAVYARHCASCHGPDGSGVADAGPPLVDPRYHEDVYPDAAFVEAVRAGVATEAWDFPRMPAVPGVGEDELGDLLAHVRSLQAAGSH